MRPDQEKVEAEIKPEHYDDDCGKAAVHVKSVKVLDVNRKAPGKNIPGGCGKYGTWNLVGKFQLAVGYIGIHHRKYQDHDAPGKKPPEMQQHKRVPAMQSAFDDFEQRPVPFSDRFSFVLHFAGIPSCICRTKYIFLSRRRCLRYEGI